MIESKAITGRSPLTRSRNFALGADTRLESVWGIKIRLRSTHHLWGMARNPRKTTPPPLFKSIPAGRSSSLVGRSGCVTIEAQS